MKADTAAASSSSLDVEWLREVLLHWMDWAASVPVLSSLVNYIAFSLHHDPWRLFLEGIMIIVLLRYLFGRRYRPKDNSVKLTQREIEDLVDEWQPEPLVPPLSRRAKREAESIPVIEGPTGIVVKIGGQDKLNLASSNYLGLVAHPKIEDVARKTLRNYGVGSCGPPGFYGTIDVHMDLERKISELLGAEAAILYSFAFASISSAIPAFAKKGDLLVCDEGIGFALQKGVIVSRAQVKYFKHNDMEDLERLLKSIQDQDKKSKGKLNRRFIVTEGLFQNSGDLCPLPQLVSLKNRFKWRLIVDESYSIGVIGKRGKGVCEHFAVRVEDIDILTGSLSNAFAAGGGYCAGSQIVIDHQRLSGAGYCFSASMPAMLAASAITAIDISQAEPDRVVRLQSNTALFRKLIAGTPHVDIQGAEVSPIIFVHLKKRFANRDDEEDLLQKVVDECLQNGVLFTRAKYIVEEEIKPPKPSICISISEGHSKEQLQQAASTLKKALEKFESEVRDA